MTNWSVRGEQLTTIARDHVPLDCAWHGRVELYSLTSPADQHLIATSQARHGVRMQPLKSAGLALAVEALAAGTNCENKVGHFQRAELCSLMLCMYLSTYMYMYMDTYMRGTVVVVLLLVVMKLSASGATLTALPWLKILLPICGVLVYVIWST